MIMRINLFALTAVVILTSACGGSNNNSGKKAEQFSALPFPDIQIPSVVDSEQERLQYLAENYWNIITDPSREFRCDSSYVSGVEIQSFEQKFANWTSVLDRVPLDISLKSIGKMYDRTLACEKRNPSSNVFETVVHLAQKYLYDPNSPVRNEEYYYPFVSRYSRYEGLSDVERGKFEREARLCGLNRIGTKATDFRFCDRNGKIRRMHDIESPYTLLFFSNPGCNACMDIINVLKDDAVISSLIHNGVLTVLNIYIDEDLDEWRSYMPVYPEEWYNCFDPDFTIRNGSLYNIRAIPSLYLLDKEKRVILKDAPEHKVFERIAI